MKHNLLFFSILTIITACRPGGVDEPNPANDSLIVENAKLRKELNENKESIESISGYFNEVENNLNAIKQREGLVSVQVGDESEMSDEHKNQIIEDIQAINALMIENRNLIGKLRAELKQAKFDISEFQKMIERLTDELAMKDAEIDSLHNALADLQFNMKLLTMANIEQKELIGMQEEEINTAYYCYGTFKELKENGIVTKEGGFIGIGRTEKLTDDFKKQYFTKVDISQTNTIDLYSKKARLITTHPRDSYEWKGGDDQVDQLVIKDAESFWSVSKYCVVIVE